MANLPGFQNDGYTGENCNPKGIGVDFDGVIHRASKGWHDGTIYDSSIVGAREALEELKEMGYKIVIYTARGDLAEVELWLDAKDIPYDQVTDRKPHCLVYIDDRGLRFTDWDETMVTLRSWHSGS